MEQITLDGTHYEFDPIDKIGEGGFSDVFSGKCDKHGSVAIKRIRYSKSDLAKREVAIAQKLIGATFSNVMPVFDAAFDPGSSHIYLSMPLASTSLKERIRKEGTFDELATSDLLKSVANGLIEISTVLGIFHRDLKPGNILLLDGNWVVADFGISKEQNADTSTNTLAGHRTPQYAAPERWKKEPTTIQTDVYSLGCVAHFVAHGNPPFCEPDLRDKHLSATPATLSKFSNRLANLVNGMLRKLPDSRPTPADVVGAIDGEQRSASGPLAAISGIADSIRQNRSDDAAKQEKEKLDGLERDTVVTNARMELETKVVHPLLEGICSQLGNVGERMERQVSIPNKSMLTFGEVIPVADSGGKSRWDVVAESFVRVNQNDPRFQWGASLWYARENASQPYLWLEVSFADLGLTGSGKEWLFELYRQVGPALRSMTVISGISVAEGPKPVLQNMKLFEDKWISLFAKACKGELRRHRTMPPRDEYWK